MTQSTRRTRGSSARVEDYEVAQAENPFVMPPDHKLFLAINKNLDEKKKKRERLKTMSIIEKTQEKHHPTIRELTGDPIPTQRQMQSGAVPTQAERDLLRRAAKKEKPRDVLKREREMFDLQLKLEIARSERQHLIYSDIQENDDLTKQEMEIEQGKQQFDEFLHALDQRAIDAVERKDKESEKRAAKTQEMHRLEQQIASLETTNTKLDENIAECQRAKEFLEKITPADWKKTRELEKEISREKRLLARKEYVEERRREKETRPKTRTVTQMVRRKKPKPEKEEIEEENPEEKEEGQEGEKVEENKEESKEEEKQEANPDEDIHDEEKEQEESEYEDVEEEVEEPIIYGDEDEDDEADAEIMFPFDDPENEDEDDETNYFSRPGLVHKLFAEIEEKNFVLIQNQQEEEGLLEKQTNELNRIKSDYTRQIEDVQNKIQKLEDDIANEDRRMLSLMNSAPSSQQSMQITDENTLFAQMIQQALEGTGIETVTTTSEKMLASMESQLLRLLAKYTQEDVSQELVKKLLKDEDWMRRNRQKQDKQAQKQQLAQERTQESMRRAKEPVHKKAGRPVVGRSAPKVIKKKNLKTQVKKVDEDEEFFMD
ncbi:hypothetical protein BLNAU_8887 [Blattamonas nauphoetae]|uniref:DUF4200 domain-containing protein n=1 Tax=Blattamonas nauphoetae TaxID=2049346 RepID=A0ABQ9XXB6_9EUKA|nr:hypothetical protein BLNAU_8887 [Blattamonas nauphoetae]